MTTGEFSFPRQSRLLKPEEFKYVFDRAVVSSDHLFRVFARAGRSSRCRLGLAVSRKVDRRAVGRNRIKRIIRESFRHCYPFGARQNGPGGDFVVVASQQAGRATGEQLGRSLAEHWRRLNQKLEKQSSQAQQRTNTPEE